jgi:hypothetical protein
MVTKPGRKLELQRTPSAGGCAAASGGGRGLSAPLPYGSLRDPLGLGTDEMDSDEIRTGAGLLAEDAIRIRPPPYGMLSQVH